MGKEVIIGAALNKLSQVLRFRSITTMGRVRVLVSVFLIIAFGGGMHNFSRVDFLCNREISDFHRQLCFSNYSSEMFPVMWPYQFLLLTACGQVVLWIPMILHGNIYLQKIIAKKNTSVKLSRKERNVWHKVWMWSRCHVCCESMVVSFVLGLFFYTWECNVPAEIYICTVISAKDTECTHQYHWQNLFLKKFRIGVMVTMLLLCIVTFQQMWNKQSFIEDLLDWNADDVGSHHGNARRNADA
ncbi:PREDICTED: uncharacterized protein LOC107353954 [Acropora digitifera]|uniref:uncharacterized protein LOC107353954 n=1 Tax=Acropora digitifera TaxID=70779 RepID=UPI00077A9D8E|nr:PREDICTED: uncharacterized protein LOC107353954 [Acropora digitifera]